MRSLILRGVFVAVACGAVGLACGANVEEGAGATGGGAGGESSVQPSGTVQPTTSSSRSSTSTETPSPTTATGPSSPCAALTFEADCLAAFPTCVPLYDDSCCPTCTSGGCADCQNEDFYACKPAAEVCNAPPACGTTPDWACQGKTPTCPPVHGTSSFECDRVEGCAVATCSPDVNCVDTECHPVRPDSCRATCHSAPPSCPAGQTAEAKDGCWTGFCINAAVCGVF